MKNLKLFSVFTMLLVSVGFMSCSDDDGIKEVSVSGGQEVDLGLSVKWAGWNIGASSPEQYGEYYAWGETQTKGIYYWDTYKFNEEDSIQIDHETLKKSYQEYLLSINGIISGRLGENVIEGAVATDVATAKWGEGWRMPTKEELQELVEGCEWTWCTYKGVAGYKVEGSNGNSIFLPAAGCYNGSSLNNAGKFGLYWSGQWFDPWRDPQDEKFYSDKAYCLDLGVKDTNRFIDYAINAYDYRFGFSVRPVKDF